MPVIMDSPMLLPLLAASACAVVAWACTRWWYRRQLAAWAQRHHKLERKLEFGAQQTAQTRKQVEKLQRELSEARRAAAVAASQLGSQRAKVAPAPAAPAPATPSLPTSKAAPNNGFADTLPM